MPSKKRKAAFNEKLRTHLKEFNRLIKKSAESNRIKKEYDAIISMVQEKIDSLNKPSFTESDENKQEIIDFFSLVLSYIHKYTNLKFKEGRGLNLSFDQLNLINTLTEILKKFIVTCESDTLTYLFLDKHKLLLTTLLTTIQSSPKDLKKVTFVKLSGGTYPDTSRLDDSFLKTRKKIDENLTDTITLLFEKIVSESPEFRTTAESPKEQLTQYGAILKFIFDINRKKSLELSAKILQKINFFSRDNTDYDQDLLKLVQEFLKFPLPLNNAIPIFEIVLRIIDRSSSESKHDEISLFLTEFISKFMCQSLHPYSYQYELHIINEEEDFIRKILNNDFIKNNIQKDDLFQNDNFKYLMGMFYIKESEYRLEKIKIGLEILNPNFFIEKLLQKTNHPDERYYELISDSKYKYIGFDTYFDFCISFKDSKKLFVKYIFTILSKPDFMSLETQKNLIKKIGGAYKEIFINAIFSDLLKKPSEEIIKLTGPETLYGKLIDFKRSQLQLKSRKTNSRLFIEKLIEFKKELEVIKKLADPISDDEIKIRKTFIQKIESAWHKLNLQDSTITNEIAALKEKINALSEFALSKQVVVIDDPEENTPIITGIEVLIESAEELKNDKNNVVTGFVVQPLFNITNFNQLQENEKMPYLIDHLTNDTMPPNFNYSTLSSYKDKILDYLKTVDSAESLKFYQAVFESNGSQKNTSAGKFVFLKRGLTAVSIGSGTCKKMWEHYQLTLLIKQCIDAKDPIDALMFFVDILKKRSSDKKPSFFSRPSDLNIDLKSVTDLVPAKRRMTDDNATLLLCAIQRYLIHNKQLDLDNLLNSVITKQKEARTTPKPTQTTEQTMSHVEQPAPQPVQNDTFLSVRMIKVVFDKIINQFQTINPLLKAALDQFNTAREQFEISDTFENRESLAKKIHHFIGALNNADGYSAQPDLINELNALKKSIQGKSETDSLISAINCVTDTLLLKAAVQLPESSLEVESTPPQSQKSKTRA